MRVLQYEIIRNTIITHCVGKDGILLKLGFMGLD